MTRCMRSMVCVAIGVLVAPVLATGQDSARAVRQVASSHTIADAVLGRKIALHLDRVRLDRALEAIESQIGIQIIYSAAEVPVTATVSLIANSTTVGQALDVLLAGTGLRVAVPSAGFVRLEPRDRDTNGVGPQQQGTVTITGHVTDGALRTPLSSASVRVDSTAFSTASSADGKYTLTGVVAGTYHVTARRVGYQPLTKDIVVSAGQALTLDFALTVVPARLNDVVTTALGDQRRYEVGNDIATINVDSLAPTAPVTDITDVLKGRVPGLEIIENGGMVGSGEAIRIRGESSLLLQSDPIIIVDGIREDNTPGGALNLVFGFGGSFVPGPSRINDIDFSQVATIDILKGPSAATEYGTDAANGVIVITTKHGTSGKPQWSASGEQDWSDIPTGFPDYYYGWGHTTGGTPRAVDCPLVAGNSRSPSVTAGTCVVDSVTHFDPLNDASTTMYGTGPRNKYDLSVGGGSDALRYYLAGGLSNATGVVHLPDVFHSQAEALGFPPSSYAPNSQDQRSLRANTFLRWGPTADVSVNAAYMSTHQATPGGASLFGGGYNTGAILNDSAHYYGYGSGVNSPLAQLGSTAEQQTDRFTGGLTLNWRPTRWFQGRATVGLDHGSQEVDGVQTPQSVYYANGGTGPIGALGSVSSGNATTDIYTTDLRGSATAALPHELRAVTSLGLQITDTREHGVGALVYNVGSSNLTLNGAAGAPGVSQTDSRAATLGGYAEEELGLAERLYLIGAVRVDAGSGFGSQVLYTVDPKVSLSWLALTRGPATLRFRGSYGVAGQQPMAGSAQLLAAPSTVWNSGQSVSAYTLTAPGDSSLRPERSEEYEGGFDLGLWANRVSVTFSAYQKITHDALYNLPLGWDLYNRTYEENIGEVQNEGIEGSISATVVDTHALEWSLTLNGSLNGNKLVHLEPGAIPIGYANQLITAGYSLNGYWGAPVHYADINHDGIIEPSEVTVGDTGVYLGSNTPTQLASLSSHVGLWRGTVTVGTVFDYEGGYVVLNENALYTARQEEASEEYVRGAPLGAQARNVAIFYNNRCCTNQAFAIGGAPAPFVENATFVRFRELSLTYNLPMHWSQAAHVSHLGLTAAVQNLALWKRSADLVDPEAGGNGIVQTNANLTNTVNNDVRSNPGLAVPLARYWVFRLNVGL